MKHYKKKQTSRRCRALLLSLARGLQRRGWGGGALELLEVLLSAHVTEILNTLLARGPCSS